MLLCRTRRAAFSHHVFKSYASSLLRLHTSSSNRNKTHPNFTNPETLSSNSNPPTSSSASIPRLSPKKTLYSLLTDLVSCPSDTDTAIDRVLDCYKGELSSNLVLRVLMSYKHLGRAKTLKFFSCAGTHMGFQFDDSVVEYMVDFLGRRKLFDDIKCLFMTLLSHQGKVSPKALSICIRFLGRQGRIKEALSLFDEMETVFGCKPDNLVCNNVLYVLCKKQSSEEMIELALSIFHKIESPDTYSCSNVIVGLCKLGRLEAALEIFGQMGRVGVTPTRSAVNVLIGELCSMSAKEGSFEKVRVTNTRRPYTILVPNMGGNRDAIQPAVTVFWTVVNSGLLPSTFIVVRLISELCRLGNTGEAVQVLRIAEERKLTCVEEGYSMVIKASCEHRRVEEAGDLFGRMLARGIKPKLAVYNSVISMLCKLGDLDRATRVFEIMNKNRCFPDSLTYIALIHAHGECKNWKAAYDLLMEMLGFGWIPHFHTYNLVEGLLREHDQLDLCLKLERKLDNQKLQKLCKQGQLDDAYEKVKSMLEKGIHLSAYARDTFEHEFQKCGKLKIAHELLENTQRVQEPENYLQSYLPNLIILAQKIAVHIALTLVIALFVGCLSRLTTEHTLSKVMNKYGRVKNLQLVRGIGGGLSGKKESGQLRFGGREKPFRAPLKIIPYEELKQLGIPPPPEGRYMSSFQVTSPPRRERNLSDREEDSERRGSNDRNRTEGSLKSPVDMEEGHYKRSSSHRDDHSHRRSSSERSGRYHDRSLVEKEHRYRSSAETDKRERSSSERSGRYHDRSSAEKEHGYRSSAETDRHSCKRKERDEHCHTREKYSRYSPDED